MATGARSKIEDGVRRFDRRIVVKKNIAARLEETFERRSWKGELIALSGNTDCYQPVEGSYGLTRACLQVMARYRNPVGIITKGSLIRRDLDLLAALAKHKAVTVYLSICFDNARQARLIEPGTPPPDQRFETMRILAAAGIPVGIALAPVIPGLNDEQIPSLLGRAAQAGAARRSEGVLFVSTSTFARPAQDSPNVGHGHHWFGNAESYFLIGDALGRGMLKLLAKPTRR